MGQQTPFEGKNRLKQAKKAGHTLPEQILSMSGDSGPRWCLSQSRRVPFLMILGPFCARAGPGRNCPIWAPRGAMWVKNTYSRAKEDRTVGCVFRVPRPFQWDFSFFSRILVPVAARFGASCRPVLSRPILSCLGLQGGTTGGKRAFRGPEIVVWGPQPHLRGYGTQRGASPAP